MQTVTAGRSAEDGVKSPRCPNCGWMDARRATFHSFFDRLVRLIRLVPYRCLICGECFYRADRTQGRAGSRNNGVIEHQL